MHVETLFRGSEARPFTSNGHIIKAANSDYLVFVAAGKACYTWRSQPAGRDSIADTHIFLLRSTDRGHTWSEPRPICTAPFGAHAAAPLIPTRGPNAGRRIYIFGTEPTLDPAELDFEVNTLGYRYSDDDGQTWSDVHIVKPVNDPDFLGISAMKPLETPHGTWIWGSHTEPFHNRMVGGIGELVTEQYVLRSTDAGATWRVYPCPSPAGSLPSQVALKYPRVEEANFVNLADGRIGASLRTIEGHIWWTESNDDGLNWSPARSTGLTHPSAPAPVRRLSDGRLIIFTHNNSHDDRAMWVQSRDKLWIALSDDEGQTWGAPRFLWGTPTPERLNGACYPDMIQDGDELHILVSYHWHDLLYLRLTLDELERLPEAPAQNL